MSAGPSTCRGIVAPSILAADFSILAEELRRVQEGGAVWAHIDIMDNHFVPNLTFGAPVVKSLRPRSNMFFDCHLMVSDPASLVEPLQAAGAQQITFHLEAFSSGDMNEVAELARHIRAAGMRAGVSIKPATPVDAVLQLAQSGCVDLVLIMTVEPGFGGQKFQPQMLDKVKQLRTLLPAIDIQVDGGIGPATAGMAAQAGANVLVAGSAVFQGDQPSHHVIEALYRDLESGGFCRHPPLPAQG